MISNAFELGSAPDLLEGLAIHKLNLQNLPISHYDTRHLIGMPLEELNLTNSRAFWLEFSRDIKSLKSITLKKGVYSQDKLKNIPAGIKIIKLD